jgi:hypothetical protein
MSQYLLITAIMGVGLLSGCGSTPINLYDDITMKKHEYNGIKAYKKGDYKQAFMYLKDPAALGYKSAQYTLSFMFLKGQYLTQSTNMGMGWLGVAKEAGVESWQAQYNTFYNAATSAQQLKIDETVALYISQYGSKAQKMTCRRSTTPRRTFGEIKIDCNKHDGTVTKYEVQTKE